MDAYYVLTADKGFEPSTPRCNRAYASHLDFIYSSCWWYLWKVAKPYLTSKVSINALVGYPILTASTVAAFLGGTSKTRRKYLLGWIRTNINQTHFPLFQLTSRTQMPGIEPELVSYLTMLYQSNIAFRFTTTSFVHPETKIVN